MNDLHIVITSKGYISLVDIKDAHLVTNRSWTSSISSTGNVYARGSVPGGWRRSEKVLLHRLITGCPRGMVVDHINGNGLDNRRSNLRVCSQSENIRNRKGPVKGRRYLGVYWAETSRKWEAKIGKDGVRHYLGVFDTQEEAAMARDCLAIKLHGEFASLNFPEAQLKCPQ